MPVKICFITNYAYRLFNPKSRIVFGGIETIFYLTAKDLAEDKKFSAGFLVEDDVHALPKTEYQSGVTIYKTSRQYRPETYGDYQVEKYHRAFAFFGQIFKFIWHWPHFDFFRLWEKLKQIGADIYVFASPSYDSLLLGLVVKLIGKKSIFIVPNDEIINKRWLFIVLKLADAVICYSRRHQQILSRRFLTKAVYLPPWYPRPKRIPTFDQRQYFLWIGRVEARKSPEVMLRLLSKLPRQRFVMVVAPSPGGKSLYRRIILQTAKLKNLTVLANVKFQELERLYRRAIAFIDTSRYVHLNLTQIQAAVSGVPNLSFFADPNGTLKTYGWGLSASGRFKRMVKNVNRLSGDKKLWQQLSEKAEQFADEVYDPKKNLVRFKQLVRQLTS